MQPERLSQGDKSSYEYRVIVLLPSFRHLLCSQGIIVLHCISKQPNWARGNVSLRGFQLGRESAWIPEVQTLLFLSDPIWLACLHLVGMSTCLPAQAKSASANVERSRLSLPFCACNVCYVFPTYYDALLVR